MSTDLAYSMTCDNLSKLPIRWIHDPYCFCNDEKYCTNKCKTIVPTEEALFPLRALASVKQDNCKLLLKKALIAESKPDTKKNYLYLTINPKPDYPLLDFMKKIRKTLESKLFIDSLAVIEQRGTDEKTMGTGYHAHILFKRVTPLNEGRTPTNIKRNLQDSYKKVCLVKNPDIMNFQFISHEYAEDKLEYMLGKKTGKGKDLKQKYDIPFRAQNNIPEYLGNPDILKSPKTAEI